MFFTLLETSERLKRRMSFKWNLIFSKKNCRDLISSINNWLDGDSGITLRRKIDLYVKFKQKYPFALFNLISVCQGETIQFFYVLICFGMRNQHESLATEVFLYFLSTHFCVHLLRLRLLFVCISHFLSISKIIILFLPTIQDCADVLVSQVIDLCLLV